MIKKNVTNLTKPTLNECEFTGVVFDRKFSPLRLWISSDTLCFDLSYKNKIDAVFIDPDILLLKKIVNNNVNLPSNFQGKIPVDFIQKICDLYEKKTFETLSFMLKANQSVIGRRAIDRALSGFSNTMPLAILLTPNGSQTICDNFKFKQKNLKIINDFSQEILQKITGREKISYYCVLDTEMGRTFVNDYMKYLQIVTY